MARRRRKSIITGGRGVFSREARAGVKIEGIEEIQQNIAKIMSNITGNKVKEVYLEGGVILRDQARANAPYDTKRKKGTHLRDAIFANKGDGSKPNILVGVRYKVPGAPHAHLVEYGTSSRSAHPFLRPAIVQVGPKIAATIKAGLLSIIGGDSAQQATGGYQWGVGGYWG